MSRHDGKVWVRKLRTHYSSHPWEVRARNHNGYDYYETFYDWADAMEAADRLARTREVVLPRITESKAMIPGSLGLSLESGRTWDGKRNTWVRDGVSMVYVASYELRPLALALLALAEQEGTA